MSYRIYSGRTLYTILRSIKEVYSFRQDSKVVSSIATASISLSIAN